MVDIAKTPVGKIIAEEIFQYLVWTSQKLEKFPRSYKFTIGDRIQSLSLDLLAATVEATYTRDRAALLRQGLQFRVPRCPSFFMDPCSLTRPQALTS